MTRPIKFRAYLHKTKNIRDVYEVVFTTKGPSVRVRAVESAEFGTHVFGTYDLIEFTGLHDKNGKEIWEGDVLAPNNREVVWHDGFMGDGSGWHTVCHNKNYTADPWTFGKTQAEVSEVLGNVLENPELVKA